MPWDSIPGTETGARPRVSLEQALRDEYPDAVAVDASLAKGRAYLAVRCEDGQVRPIYLILDREGFSTTRGEDPIMAKELPLDESPSRWPMKVAQALTTWSW
jgi:hypothetical protein